MLKLLLSVLLIFQLAGCGTLMHPERKGQRGGDIDVGVAILDGLGLLFFIIPGVIAFAVDFSNGTIYLPPGHRSTTYRTTDLRRIRFDPARTSTPDVEALIAMETGRTIKLAGAQVSELHSLDEMMARFATNQDVRLASREAR